MIQRAVQSVILRVYAASRHSRRNGWIVENRREIQAASLPVIDGWFHVEPVYAADHLVHGAESQASHVLPNLLGEEEKEINDVLGLPLEPFAQHRILRGDADRTSV